MIVKKMTPAFQKAEGGLFSAVEKADVGDAVLKMGERGVALMMWADPFYPHPSIPPHVAQAMTDSINSGFASHYTAPRPAVIPRPGQPLLRAPASRLPH